ncbi:cysteine--tRNA ligase [Patescibacteria group bacterium]|nr:cysteine--tRNA ligase [Patescibacteria group bacterium]
MNMLRIYNTLTRKIEDFEAINPPNVGMYSCGPTVYDYSHIGHMRRYLGDDILLRVLKFDGFNVNYVMNVTDVGHLVSDGDTGEDKMEKGAEKLGMSPLDVAKKFEKQFFDGIDSLNIQKPDAIMHATDYIKDQIELVQVLEEKGFTYRTEDGIYFDTSKFPNYTELSKQNLDELKKGARVNFIKGKKNIADFALWKFSPQDKKRQMEWKSPWGVGFPGWHLECSAMSMKALGVTFDIHTGGIDHINIHHTNEIAQSEAASGKHFVNYWVHNAFLVVGNEKMSKSLNNFITIQDVMKKRFDPLAFRYLCLQTHYRQEMNFTWDSLKAAQTALRKLREEVAGLPQPDGKGSEKFGGKFFEAINDDLNMPRALAIVWELLKSDSANGAKAQSILEFDQILGLKLDRAKEIVEDSKKIPLAVLELVKERVKLRKLKRFHLSDEYRHKIRKMGYDIEDTKNGTKVFKLTEI